MIFHKIKIEVPQCRFSKYAWSMPPHVRLAGRTGKSQDMLVPLCVIACSVKALYFRRDIALSSVWDTTLIVRRIH